MTQIGTISWKLTYMSSGYTGDTLNKFKELTDRYRLIINHKVHNDDPLNYNMIAVSGPIFLRDLFNYEAAIKAFLWDAVRLIPSNLEPVSSYP